MDVELTSKHKTADLYCVHHNKTQSIVTRSFYFTLKLIVIGKHIRKYNLKYCTSKINRKKYFTGKLGYFQK